MEGEPEGAAATAYDRRRAALIVASVVAALAGSAGAWIGARLFLLGLRNLRIAARLAFRVATFTLYRRCPDCRRFIRSDARVCLHCGYRKPPGRAGGRRARDQAVTGA